MWLFRRRAEIEAKATEDRERLLRLDAAEREARELNARADKAIKTLDARNARNHWAETVQLLIHGAA